VKRAALISARCLSGIATGLIAVGSLAACATTPHDPDSAGAARAGAAIAPAGGAAKGAASRPGGDLGLSLPIESYLIRADQLDVLNKAGSLLVSQCMATFGFSYQERPAAAVAQPGQMARRYGIMDAAAASQYGYHPAPGDGIRPKPVTRQAASATSGGTLPAAQWLALTGRGVSQAPAGPAVAPVPTAKVNGHPVPAGGCEGQSKQRVLGEDSTAVASLQGVVDQINDAGFVVSQKDPQVHAGILKWSACMRAKGYTFADPLAAVASADLNQAQPSKPEIATAVADVACKSQTNLISTWSKAEAGYENAQIKKNAVTLNGYRSRFTAHLQQATKTLSANGAK
jgi:hypothetical protein